MTRAGNLMRQGFSLLELSVALGIISLLVVTGVSMGSGALKAADRVTTQERLATIKQALETYAKLNGFLPCPANRAETPSGNTTSFGVEWRTNQLNCNVGLVEVASSAYIGALPVRALGLPDSYAGDAWGNKFTYAVSKSHINATDNYAANPGTLQVQYGDRNPPAANYALTTSYALATATAVTALSSDAGKLQLTSTAHGLTDGNLVYVYFNPTSTLNGYHLVTGTAANQFTLQNVPFVSETLSSATVQRATPTAGAGATYVVVSHGADGIGAFPMLGTSVPTANVCPNNNVLTNGNQTENCDDNNGAPNVPNLIFYDTEFNNSTSQTSLLFDDYIIWGTNAATRSLLKPPVYDDNCPPGTCAAWCAKCTDNFPRSNGKSEQIDGSTPPALSNAVLCQKIVTNTTTTSCEATCIWSGVNASTQYVGCP